MHRLLSERVDRPARAHLVLVRHHVPQPLVVDDADKDLHLHLGAVEARVHRLGAVVRKAGRAQLLPKVVHRTVLVRELEGRRVLRDAVRGARLGCHHLEEHTDGHARREAVRVEQDVGRDARLGEGHVLCGPQPREHALLAVARRKLVARDGIAVVAEPDEGDGRVAAALLPVSVAADDAHLLHHGCASRLSARRLVVPQLVL
mmetsp:Transcript_48343/g.151932  ORF Transcript_48343/g.151932 Transcript_48343/m.151932 type:complete len:203 (+) Transcript_48343:526-1134(+)